MSFELSRDEFICLPPEKRDLVIYDNLLSIKNDIGYAKKSNQKTNFKFIIGYIWLFVISAYVGLKKYLPLP